MVVPLPEPTDKLALMNGLFGLAEETVSVVPKAVVPPFEPIDRLGETLSVVMGVVPTDALTLTRTLVGLAVAEGTLLVVPPIVIAELTETLALSTESVVPPLIPADALALISDNVVPPLIPADALALISDNVVPPLTPAEALTQATPRRQVELLGDAVPGVVVAAAEALVGSTVV